MKLKGLKNRAYNIYYNTHTVAGIAISFALFVIFYAGSFSLFRHDIVRWENPNARIESPEEVNVDRTLAAVEAHYEGFAEAEAFTVRMPSEESPFVKFYGAEYVEEAENEDKAESKEENKAKDENTTGEEVKEEEKQKEYISAFINVDQDYHLTDHEESETTIGNTLYRLHYFGQIPVIGLFLSGFVALFFLFASITGIMIHWRNIATRFYAFVIEGKWKRIWSNAHTVLGVIGFPFQIAYGLTGAFFGLLTLLLAPSAFILFGGDTDKIVETVNPAAAIKIDKDAPEAEHASLQSYYLQVKDMYPDVKISNVRAFNHGRADGYAMFFLDDGRTINGTGQVVYALNSGQILYHKPPSESSYAEAVLNVISKLHFANFGGLPLRIIYFILAMITCFMILSGVLLWQEARNSKAYTDKQRRFHHRVTKVYLAITLGLFPATAIIFIANKLVPMEWAGRTTYVDTAFFLSWLLLIIAGLFWNNFRKLNRNYLRIGGLLSLLVPVANGVITGDWVWKTLASAQWYVASVDIFWMMTGLTALGVALFVDTSEPPKKAVKVKSKERIVVPKMQVEPAMVNYKKTK
ncbi:MAG: PepSY-associated TM helix domain-containing protein [Bacteroidota bacterium]